MAKEYKKRDSKGDKPEFKKADKRKENYKGSKKARSKAGEKLSKGEELEKTTIRLNKYIANSGLCSRRQADDMIAKGRVKVDGEPVTEMGFMVAPGSKVKVNGSKIEPKQFIYAVMNKPKGYITTKKDPQDRKTVMDLIKMEGSHLLYPVGRLDRNTTGLLLLTNDGDFSQAMTHPSFEVKKIYRVKLDRKPEKQDLLAWVEGVQLEDGLMAFEQVGFVDSDDPTVLGLEIHSGRNRIVRRMFEHLNYEVKGLDRVMMGEFDHVKLGRGKWRLLNDKEIRYVEKVKRKFKKSKG